MLTEVRGGTGGIRGRLDGLEIEGRLAGASRDLSPAFAFIESLEADSLLADRFPVIDLGTAKGRGNSFQINCRRAGGGVVTWKRPNLSGELAVAVVLLLAAQAVDFIWVRPQENELTRLVARQKTVERSVMLARREQAERNALREYLRSTVRDSSEVWKNGT